MKYLKTYEMRLSSRLPENTEPEVIKFFDYLKMLVMNIDDSETDGDYSAFLRIEDNKNDKGWKTYSIILNSYFYFIYQFDYKEDGMWIKYTCNDKISDELKKIEPFFDAIAIKHNEWGWCFDRETFMKEIDNIDMYINAKSYNL
jgi:hypothetical protein